MGVGVCKGAVHFLHFFLKPSLTSAPKGRLDWVGQNITGQTLTQMLGGALKKWETSKKKSYLFSVLHAPDIIKIDKLWN